MDLFDSKRIHFRRYLRRTNFFIALNESLLRLYEQDPPPLDPVFFVRQALCPTCPDAEEIYAARAALQEALKKLGDLEEIHDFYKALIVITPEEVKELLEDGYKKLVSDKINGSSLLHKYFTHEILHEYIDVFTPPPIEASLYDSVQSGLEHMDSVIGIYAAEPKSYDVYRKLFHPIICEYHGHKINPNDELEFSLGFGNVDVENFDPERKYTTQTRMKVAKTFDEFNNIDIDKRYILSTRIRVARSIEGYPFFPKLSAAEFREVEDLVKGAATSLGGELAGTYHTLRDMDFETQEDLIQRHILYKRGDKFLKTAGCYRFWPSGRGIFISRDQSFLIWVNGEDHLRIISMLPGDELGTVYSRLMNSVQVLEEKLAFVEHPRYGYLAACPSNVGTSLRASVHIRLPNLYEDKETLDKLVESLNLQIRGTNGKTSPIIDGVMDLSNKRRLGLSEYDTVKAFMTALITLINEEDALAGYYYDDDNTYVDEDV